MHAFDPTRTPTASDAEAQAAGIERCMGAPNGVKSGAQDAQNGVTERRVSDKMTLSSSLDRHTAARVNR
jgi:hypothetical protein